MDVFIGVGSNLGDRLVNIQKAIDCLKASVGIEIIKLSSIIVSDPQGGPPQDKYLNCVIKIKTYLSARDLLNTLQTIEKKLGRKRLVENGPRTIDLDILLYGDDAVNEEDLVIPHPRMRQREFVMGPLKEILNSVERIA
ncbi:MAG: 2-amino-4-hydroxy-6-hydroxymethyldihydropteridine diphosphokinase [Candidatus Omnitrophota bacterium]|nr:2-amino-4-hydroxy-6-hydroxymethyldihydropteridine diphosphokinase [Candidatus Omnitrophota bacterium]